MRGLPNLTLDVPFHQLWEPGRNARPLRMLSLNLSVDPQPHQHALASCYKALLARLVLLRLPLSSLFFCSYVDDDDDDDCTGA